MSLDVLAEASASQLQFSVVTVNYNNARLLVLVLEKTLRALRHFRFEVIIVDNASTDDSLPFLQAEYGERPGIKVFDSGRNGGFGFGCNFGAGKAVAPLLWFLNSDAWVDDAAGLDRALALANRSDSGIIGTSVLLDNGVASPQGGSDMSFGFFFVSSFRLGALFRRLPSPLRNGLRALLKFSPGSFGRYARSFDHHSIANPAESRGVGGASFLIRMSAFRRLGGFDERFFLYDEDGDLCLRSVDIGLRNWIDPGVRVLTFPSATTSKVPSTRLKRIKRESRLLLIDKHFRGPRRLLLRAITHLTWRLL